MMCMQRIGERCTMGEWKHRLRTRPVVERYDVKKKRPASMIMCPAAVYSHFNGLRRVFARHCLLQNDVQMSLST